MAQAFLYYGINGVMSIAASYEVVLSYIIIVCLAISYVVFGLYALSADGYIRKLLLLWIGVFCIATLFLLRMMMDVGKMMIFDEFSFRQISAALASGLIGVLYLWGGLKKFKQR